MIKAPLISNLKLLFPSRIDSINSNESLDCHQLNGSKLGHLTWPLDKLKQLDHSIPMLRTSVSLSLDGQEQITNTSNQFVSDERVGRQHSTDSEESIEFRYYSGVVPEKVIAKSVELKLIYAKSVAPIAASILPRNLMEFKMHQQPNEYFKFMIQGMWI